MEKMLERTLLPEVLTLLLKPWLVKVILQELVPHLPNLHFSPLDPHPVLLSLHILQLQMYLCCFPMQERAAPGFQGGLSRRFDYLL